MLAQRTPPEVLRRIDAECEEMQRREREWRARPRAERAAFVATQPRRRNWERDGTTELRDQVGEWEQDELRRITQERGQANMCRGTDGIWHHQDHLAQRLTGHDEAKVMKGGIKEDQTHMRNLEVGLTDQRLTELGGMNEGIEDDQTHTWNLEVGLTGQRLTELRGITDRVVSHFVDKALGQPSGTQVSAKLLWS
jgi:hypothetical protein